MIKIIKEGKVPKNYKTIFNAKCEKCNCEFEFEYDDFTRIEKRFDGNYYIKCPCCNHEITGKRQYFNPQSIEVDRNDK